ncbi:MAG: protein kinase [Oligoflexus sp.]|nr:protein kinase [Oligoflexus sp.]
MSRQNLLVGKNIADRYCITGEIGGGGMGRVYSAIPFSDPSQTVAIKVIERGRLDYEDVLRFQREAALMSRLRHPNIIAFHELGLYRSEGPDGTAVVGGYYIVMEVAQGHDLKESLIKGGRKRLDFFFELGLQVSAALEYTHAKNIIHRDIKPQNIIIERQNDSEGGLLVKVLDFGIARLGDLDLYSDEGAASDIAGTPLYMAPENSKFLDAPIDHRVDLYSLGCMLYEVLAGKPPFSGSTREKLAREHAMATPESLTTIRPDIPDVVNDIVMKLMAKHPKDRYQTSFGLHVDLQRVKKMLLSGRNRTQRFILGRYDRLNILPSSVPMVGRQEDFETLISNYSAIAKDTGRSRLVVVRGAGGTGKTRLMKEFRGYLSKNKIRYISTSFSRHENNLPFNALANGFNEYLVHVYKTQPTEAEEIRRKVKTLLGPTGKILASVVQGLKPYLLKDSSGLPQITTELDLDREGDFADFSKAFSDFTRCLANESEPVAFFFDDMHWADDKSLDLIDRFLSYNNSQRFLLIISYRTIGVQQGAAFQNFLTKFAKLRRRYQEIDMGALSDPSVGELSRSILGLNKQPDKNFVSYLYDKTQGNPLYLLELHRSLVFQEMLSLDDQGRWRIELDEINRSDVVSNSIDLLLNRLSEMVEPDRRILEIAAIIGTQFTSDILQALPDSDPLRIARVLHRAMTAGLLIMTSAQSRPAAANAAGRTYSFLHRSIREALVDGMAPSMRCEVHRLVALRLETGQSTNRPQLIFSLAHHFFHACRAPGESDPVLIEKALEYNMRAGMKAMEIDSRLTAQRYLENARSMLPMLKTHSPQVSSQQKLIYHALADIQFAQREYGEAAKLYFDLRKMKLSSNEYAFVVYKLTHLSLVSGNVSATLKEMALSFRKLGFPSIRLDFKTLLKIGWQLATSIFMPINKTIPGRALMRSDPDNSSFHPLSLYLIGQYAGLAYDKRVALAYHSELLGQSVRHSLPEELVLRMVCDHAIILSYLGFQNKAYQFLELVFEAVKQKSSKTILGYATYQQTLLVDQYQGKLEDFRFSLELIQTTLDTQDFQLQAMQERIFRIVTFLFSGDGKALTHLFQSLPNLLTVRHWLTAKAVSMYLFWLLLIDSRELIVSYGVFVKKRNSSRHQRRGDLFYRVIEAIVSLAAGEREHARTAYYIVLANFQDNLESPLLLPYEIDFMLLFIGFFPDVFAMEYGDDLWQKEEIIPALNKTLKIASHRRHHRRAVPMLMRARLMDRLGKKKVKLYYDIALKRSKITQQPLIEMLTRMWFARHLSRSRAILRADYFGMAEEIAKNLNLELISSMLRKIRKDLGEPTQLPQEILDSTSGGSMLAVDPLLLEHLALMPRFKPNTMSLEDAKRNVFEIIRARLDLENVFLITNQDVKQFEERGHPPDDRFQEMIAYASPYFNLRSSLTIPVGDAPWRQKFSSPYRPTPKPMGFRAEVTSVTQSMSRPLSESQHSENTALLPSGHDATNATNALKLPNEDFDEATNNGIRVMNTLVPVRYANQSLGLLFLESAKIQDEDSTALRHTLDCLGAEMGTWMRAYLPMETKPEEMPLFDYLGSGYYLEPCSWLHMWTEGNLRNSRENAWYLGLHLGDDSYLMVYCRLNGPEDLRGTLSSRLWHEVLTMRTLFAGGGRDHLSPEEIQEFLEKYLRGYPGVENLESISLSFSVAHKTTGDTWSGHFGASRPLLLGVENNVTPLNRIVLTLGNDRSLRYWKVQASQGQRGVLILPHDSSKLDRLDLAALRELNFENLTWDQKRWRFLDYLRQNLIEGQVPRYFVAASWNLPAQLTQ